MPNRTYGPAYEPVLDSERMQHQMQRVRRELERAAARGQWLTVQELAARSCAPECSTSAQIRHLRKPQFGSYTIERRRREGYEHLGLHEYRMILKRPASGELFL